MYELDVDSFWLCDLAAVVQGPHGLLLALGWPGTIKNGDHDHVDAPFLFCSAVMRFRSRVGSSTISMPKVAVNCFCAPANTFRKALLLGPSTATKKKGNHVSEKTARWSNKRHAFPTFFPDAIPPYGGPRELAGQSVADQLFDHLSRLVVLDVDHGLVAITIALFGVILVVVLEFFLPVVPAIALLHWVLFVLFGLCDLERQFNG
jgi:hypothetical protein